MQTRLLGALLKVCCFCSGCKGGVVIRHSICALALFVAVPALAQFGQVSAPPDPYLLAPTDSLGGGAVNLNTKAVALRAQTLNPALRNLVIVAAGQSNIQNVAPNAYTPSNASAIDNLNIYDGATYAAADPLIGCTGVAATAGNPMLRLADQLIAAGLFDRVVIVPIAIGNTLVADWETGKASTRVAVAFKRLAARGMIGGTNVTVIALWGQGEQDGYFATPQATYTASLNNIIASSRAAGFNGTWFVATQTQSSIGTSSSIEAAQAAVVNHGANVWAGVNADALLGSNCGGLVCRIGDNIHWTDAGSASYAAGWRAALHLFGAPF